MERRSSSAPPAGRSTASEGPAREDHPRRPLAPYGVSKLAGEEYIAAYSRLYRGGHVSLRYGNVFGPRQDPHGEAGAATLAAAAHEGAVFNVGTGSETSVLDLYERIQRVAGIEREPEFADARPGELQRSVLDPSLAQRELDWKAKRSLDEGLAETWAWISGD